jgi:hypothetical protein
VSYYSYDHAINEENRICGLAVPISEIDSVPCVGEQSQRVNIDYIWRVETNNPATYFCIT